MKHPDFIPLSEVVKAITVGYVGPMAGEYQAQGVPFLRSLNVKPFQFSETDLKFISPDFHRKILKSALQPGDVVAVRTGNPGASCVIPKTLPETNCSDLVVIRCSKKTNPYFVSYYINSITQSIGSQSVGAIQKHFNIGSAKEIKFPKLSYDHQFRASTILRLLDEKIELNNRINAELEGLAKLLYDYWFVQFDFPMTAEQAAAHGDPTLNRQIPNGWNSSTLGDDFRLYQPKTISEKDLKPNGKYSVYGANGIVGKYDQFNHEDGRIALTCRGSTCGTLTRTEPFSSITGNAMVIGPKETQGSYNLLYVENLVARSGVHRIITGSGQPQITRSNLEGLQTIKPALKITAAFDQLTRPFIEELQNLKQQNQELADLRDWLLPMLMNGQVTVQS